MMVFVLHVNFAADNFYHYQNDLCKYQRRYEYHLPNRPDPGLYQS